MTGTMLTVGVDLGATKVLVGAVDPAGRVVARCLRPTGADRGPEAILADIIECLREVAGPPPARRVAGIGIGVAGQVDATSGTVLFAPNLGWQGFPLGERVREAVGLPVVVLNDVQAATVGEHEFGAGRQVSEMTCLFVGTGVGGGVVTGGQLLRGCTGSAAEFGHTTVAFDGEMCRCGSRGCLEAYAGGWAIARRAREAIAANPAAGAALLAGVGGDAATLTAATVVAADQAGDPLAHRILDQAAAALGAGAASIVNAFNPCVLVLGGGVVEGCPRLVESVRQSVRERALPAPGATVRIAQAALGSEAGAIGAAVRVRREIA